VCWGTSVATGADIREEESFMRIAVLTVLGLAACDGEVPFYAQQQADAAPMQQPDAATTASLDCDTYCTRVMTNCGGVNAQYGSMDTCKASCARFPIGTLADTSGNTLGCRMYHAMNAGTAPDVHCLHAGPAGGGHCGMPCDGFCALVVPTCATEYPTSADCFTACANFAATPTYAFSVSTGNNLSCRIHHATNATMDPATHCPHTAVTSPVCQ
jgi:hypothetical protein